MRSERYIQTLVRIDLIKEILIKSGKTRTWQSMASEVHRRMKNRDERH